MFLFLQMLCMMSTNFQRIHGTKIPSCRTELQKQSHIWPAQLCIYVWIYSLLFYNLILTFLFLLPHNTIIRIISTINQNNSRFDNTYLSLAAATHYFDIHQATSPIAVNEIIIPETRSIFSPTTSASTTLLFNWKDISFINRLKSNNKVWMHCIFNRIADVVYYENLMLIDCIKCKIITNKSTYFSFSEHQFF